MGKKGGENSRKAAGQARKADAAASKKAAEDSKKAAAEDAEWQKGAKSNAKKEAEAAKKAEQARKKAEREAALAEEEKSLPSRAAPKNTKTAVKKTNPSRGGIDSALAQASEPSEPSQKALNARSVGEALDIFKITDEKKEAVKVDRHPERRAGAALAAFTERRLQEMREDGTAKVLNRRARLRQITEEFEKSPENPKHGLHVKHNATQEEIRAVREEELARTEAILTGN
ncbi:DUF1014-domain-containing protein [Whalleya microplaca]|nr:DUF1014-domain-containing protein [Whalleya microplaca]